MSIKNGLEQALSAMFIVVVAVTAVVGWAVIEGIIWLFNNISVSIN